MMLREIIVFSTTSSNLQQVTQSLAYAMCFKLNKGIKKRFISIK